MIPTASPTLYDPAFEHDACGVGFVCHVDNEATHALVRAGLQLLANLDHRGACGCDADSGDGAGLIVQCPDGFLRAVCAETGFTLPAPGAYGVGMLFLPQDPAARRAVQALVVQHIDRAGLDLLGWRGVPTQPAVVGVTARATAPAVWQVFIGGDALAADALERALFVLRKRLEQATDALYVVSLSARTLVYKGMLTPAQVGTYYPDLQDPRFASALALVHSRFSTNTLPAWPLAHPFRMLCHNGEINTLRGNVHWMHAREAGFADAASGEDLDYLAPALTPGGSDSQILDNALELLCHTGRSLPEAMMMLIPEAWEQHPGLDPARRAFYAYHAGIMEPWDGPATVCFTDGRYIGATLDRNGLRPSRYTVTHDGLVILASETGVLDLDPARVRKKGRLQPGRLFLVDLHAGRIVDDAEIKAQVSQARPYEAWLDAHQRTLADLAPPPEVPTLTAEARHRMCKQWGYTLEDIRLLMAPMAQKGKEAIGSMGNDTPLAVLSMRPRPLFDYFKQLFAQVTNPPLDAIREALVTSLAVHLGPRPNLFAVTPHHARQLYLSQPVLTNAELAQVSALDADGLRAKTLPMRYPVAAGGPGLEAALTALCAAASEAVAAGYTLLVLSDRGTDVETAGIPSLLATGAVHHHLIRAGQRSQCDLLVETAEAREVHHFCLLLGYGAGAVNPYLALESVAALVETGRLQEVGFEEAAQHYISAVGKGILKVMSKMGISTLASYRGAQIFEAVGIHPDVIAAYFTGTPSRIGGIGLDVVAEEMGAYHAQAYPPAALADALPLDVGGRYQWRRGGEGHLFNPLTVAKLQHAVQRNEAATYTEFSDLINAEVQRRGALRGLLAFDFDRRPAVPLDEVEPWTEIVKRFKTGAMSYGSISQETHETLAEAMNRIGGRSNTGEGGEDPARYDRNNPKRSRIKQVASGRFGVTIAYLTSADEIQIKMAQGAKPGEGGQLPGQKVYPWIARTRHSTPYVGLISPPPHHDIYSIEDLAQLIHDLKNANPSARISVKLVSEVGVGTIAAGVAKGKADVVLISGYDGGTGAAPQTSIMHAGLPWELGLAETNQTLVRNGLRNRIRVECDGQLKTGRDVAVAALLGADEFGFATAPLVALGCIMMRKCHLNTCPVGIATQDPELRNLFKGEPEHVVNYLHFVAEELRALMAQLGFRTLAEMVGQVDSLRMRTDIDHWKARYLDLAPLLHKPTVPDVLIPFDAHAQDHGLAGALDHDLIAAAQPALEQGASVEIRFQIRNTHRTVGTLLSHTLTRLHGRAGLPEDTITFRAEGSAGQSFGAFAAPGLTMHLKGDANDYLGKGLSGAKVIVRPPDRAAFDAGQNIIIGNVALYGATRGEAYIRGQAGERFAVRNSGARAVVEGVGDHGCEYMTGGRVVVLGPTGRNFAAGMSGGMAYILDGTGDFRAGRCNTDMVDLEPLTNPAHIDELYALVTQHWTYTQSEVARWVLDHWETALQEFVLVIPTEYRRALETQSAPTVPEPVHHPKGIRV